MMGMSGAQAPRASTKRSLGSKRGKATYTPMQDQTKVMRPLTHVRNGKLVIASKKQG